MSHFESNLFISEIPLQSSAKFLLRTLRKCDFLLKGMMKNRDSDLQETNKFHSNSWSPIPGAFLPGPLSPALQAPSQATCLNSKALLTISTLSSAPVLSSVAEDVSQYLFSLLIVLIACDLFPPLGCKLPKGAGHLPVLFTTDWSGPSLW